MLAKSTPGMLLTAAAVRPWSAALWTCCSGDDASSRATACSIQDVKAAARPRLPGILLTGTCPRWLRPLPRLSNGSHQPTPGNGEHAPLPRSTRLLRSAVGLRDHRTRRDQRAPGGLYSCCTEASMSPPSAS